MKKILYFDTETTGLDPLQNSVIQLSGIVEIDNAIQETFNLNIAPFPTDIIDDKALEINRKTKEQIFLYPSPEESYIKILSIFDKYIDKYDRTDKFYFAGHNIRFDIDFLNNFFKKNNNQFFGSYCNWRLIDSLSIIHFMDFCGKIKLDNYKLQTICDYFGIPLNAHDALSDITATRELINKLCNEQICLSN